MEDKDRLGDKLHDKGKADEDRYIAEQERKRLERLRAAQAARSTGSGACPRDGSALVPHSENGVTVEACPTCKGMWVDPGELKLAVKQKNEAALLHWVRSLFGA
ncbi:MAG: zf-TFIIB domain-containing protein [Candidatus Binatia bacterium]